MISCLFLPWWNVFAQNVGVNLSVSSEKARVGEDIWINCTVYGILQENDTIVISKSEYILQKDIFTASGTDGTTTQDDIRRPLCYITPHALGRSSNCSLVHSIGSANQSDAGNYTCTLLRHSTILARDTIFMEVRMRNLPYDIVKQTVCYNVPSGSVFYEGDIIELNCLSTVDNSTVILGWSRSDNQRIPKNNLMYRTKDHVVTVLNITLTLQEHGVIFTCDKRSEIFTGLNDMCSFNALSIMPRSFNLSTQATNYTTTMSPNSGWRTASIIIISLSAVFFFIPLILLFCHYKLHRRRRALNRLFELKHVEQGTSCRNLQLETYEDISPHNDMELRDVETEHGSHLVVLVSQVRASDNFIA